MVPKAKITCLATLSLIALMASGAFLTVHADSSYASSEQNLAYSCLTKVLNIDLGHYNVQQEPDLTLPSGPNDTSITEQVSYNLTSSDSHLLVIFLFKDGALYQLALSTLSGSVVTARNYTNLNDAAVDFLSRYEAVSTVDLTPLIRLVLTLNGTTGKTVNAGNLTLYASSGPILPGHTATSFRWLYSADNATVDIDFDNGVFYNFQYYGFTSQDSEAATNALPTPSQKPTAVPPNQAVKSMSSETPIADQQEKQDTQTLTYIMVAIAAIIVAASIIAVYQWKSQIKARKPAIAQKLPSNSCKFTFSQESVPTVCQHLALMF